MSILPQDQILDLFGAAVASGLAAPGLQNTLLGGINPYFTGLIRDDPTANGRLLNTLYTMNATERLTDGTVPLRIWLGNAAALTTGREHAKTFRQALDEVDHRVSGSPRPPRP